MTTFERIGLPVCSMLAGMVWAWVCLRASMQIRENGRKSRGTAITSADCKRTVRGLVRLGTGVLS